MVKVKACVKLLLKGLGALRRWFCGLVAWNSVKVVGFGQSGYQVFFGYYDISPFSQDGDHILAMKVSDEGGEPTISPAQLGFFSLSGDQQSMTVFAETETWCWQQGCRLQWFPFENENYVFYNCIISGEYGSVIQNPFNGQVVKRFPIPLYALTRDGKWGLSLNFSRLQRLRPGYGYGNLPDETMADVLPEDDGIWLLDLEKSRKRLLFTIKDIGQMLPDPSWEDGEHYFNHILLNPSGTRFLFFHIVSKGRRRVIRLLTSDLDGNNIKVLTDTGTPSHYNWKSDDEIIATIFYEESGIGYYIINDPEGGIRKIGDSKLTEDGHPSYSNDLGSILTDTYPNLFGERSILLFDIGTERVLRKFNFYSPPKYEGEHRCDLHPRWDLASRRLCFDSTHEGVRKLYVLSP